MFASDGTVFDTPTNIGSGVKDELILDFTLPFDPLGWKGALLKGELTKRWSAVTDPTTGRQRAISNLHPTDWNVSFNQDLPRWNFSAGVDLFGGFSQTAYRFNLIEVFKLKTYVRPYAEWKPRPDISLRFEMPLATDSSIAQLETDLLRTLLFAAEQHGISVAALGNLDTLPDRIHAEAVAANSVTGFLAMVSAWSRKTVS